MFVIACLGMLSLVYWICALIAQLLLVSPQERALPPAARAGAGLLWLLTYFSAGWQVFSPALTWLVGVLLLLLWLGPRVRCLGDIAWWRGLAVDHAPTFGACVAIALVFFAPLAVQQRFGPFSEGGGDVSIYADTALYLGKLQLSARGTPASTPADFAANVRDTLDTTINRDLTLKRALERYEKADRAPMNPPAAENAVYRAVVLRSFSPFLYVPYVAFDFVVAGATNYALYYGFQALVYALLIACAWATFRRFGRAAAVVFTALLFLSHSLISVPYNTYSAQTLALFSCVLLLCLVFNGVRAWTWTGARAILIPFTFIWVSYAHYFSILAPVALIALLLPRDVQLAGARWRWPRATEWLALAGAIVLMALLLWGGSEHSIRFLRDLVLNRLRGEQNVFMGEHIAVFSFRWLEWLFGFVSQQHVTPLAVELGWVNGVIGVGIAAAIVAFAAAATLAGLRVLDGRIRDAARPRAAAIFALLVAVAALHVYSAQAYVYTQAKGAQNVIPVLYAALAVGSMLAFAGEARGRISRAAVALLVAGITVFAATLAVPRGVFGYKLGRGLDRATILEPSFFSEARRVVEQDARVFVLFEPRTSADLYMSNEPFFGARMIPTRHLALTRMRFDRSPPEPQRVDGSFFVEEGDLEHLWKLGARRRAGRDTWSAQPIAGAGAALHLFADNYVQDQRVRPRPGSRETARFSWLRNGSALVYLPAGGAHVVQATLVDGDGAQAGAMRTELARRIQAGELAGARLEEAAGGAVMTFQAPPSARARLLRVSLYSGEYWLNVRVDGVDLPKSPFAADESIRLSASLPAAKSAERVVRIAWSGAAGADSQDWIGVFPEGGEDATRIAFKFTGGREAGSLDLEVPAASPLPLEVRFFRAGTWNAAETARVEAAPR